MITSSVKGSAHLVGVLAILKWVFVVAFVIWGAMAAIFIETSTTWSRTWEITSGLGGLILALLAWVTFGLAQHGLGMLTILAAKDDPPVVHLKTVDVTEPEHQPVG